ncbi:MerR family transcriptional regulator [Ferrovibrio sp.]|uniref:MerR family transcriptional regulator n=1 Tax=Ferrovibrio sp. TaxID=1917215 RepID=UPI0026334124|nr:MerR family transcriptional regulator [Ferrovibrio sp.]
MADGLDHKTKGIKQPATAKAKAGAAFRTIGEVADQLDLPQHVLRFWEKKFHQIRPVKRNGGRRYYRTEDIALLGEIRILLHDQGYTIRGVQKLLREGGLAKAVRARAQQDKTLATPATGASGFRATKPAGQDRQIGMPFDLLNDMGSLRQALKTCLKELEGIHADIVMRQNR